jgi:hypothetical protein
MQAKRSLFVAETPTVRAVNRPCVDRTRFWRSVRREKRRKLDLSAAIIAAPDPMSMREIAVVTGKKESRILAELRAFDKSTPGFIVDDSSLW